MSFGDLNSPLSKILENMVMEEIKQTALHTYLNPPSLWVRYVDDVYAVVEKLWSSHFMTT